MTTIRKYKNIDMETAGNYMYSALYSVVHFINSVRKLLEIIDRPIKMISANSADPDQTPKNAASDPVLHCLNSIYSNFYKCD